MKRNKISSVCDKFVINALALLNKPEMILALFGINEKKMRKREEKKS